MCEFCAENAEPTTDEVRESLKNVGMLIYTVADRFSYEDARYVSLLFQNSVLIETLIDMNLQMGNIDAVGRLTAMLKKNIFALFTLVTSTGIVLSDQPVNQQP